jgi:hypothetical protein
MDPVTSAKVRGTSHLVYGSHQGFFFTFPRGVLQASL